jgi:hypothetical protein
MTYLQSVGMQASLHDEAQQRSALQSKQSTQHAKVKILHQHYNSEQANNSHHPQSKQAIKTTRFISLCRHQNQKLLSTWITALLAHTFPSPNIMTSAFIACELV